MKPRLNSKSEKYEVSIPSRDEILGLLRKLDKPTNSKLIATELGVKTGEGRVALRRRLKAMVRDGQIIRNRRAGYGLLNKMDLVAGRVIGHADGFGFLVPDQGGEDIFLSARTMRSLLHGDRAVVRVAGKTRRGKPEGALVEVLERANEQIVGRYFEETGVGFVVPDNKRLHQDIYISAADKGKARHGQFVVTRLIKQPDKHTQPVGRIIEIIGEHAAPGMATDIAIRAYELPHAWPDAVKKEINEYRPDSKINTKGRKDLRNLPIVTIDGEDARDFDDAVFCEKQGDGWRLIVAIADVSHYVRTGSALDTEAMLRGTSVYFPDRVIPMLPEVLSNELCSLKPDADRLCIACEMHINNLGQVKRYQFFEAVIRSAARLTYTETAAVLVDKDPELSRRYKSLLPGLENLYTLYQLMHQRRSEAGLLDFETTEARLIFDEVGNVESIKPLLRNDAHRLIEEFMLAANVAAAEFLLESEVAILYRNHESPKEEKLSDVREFLSELGLSLGGGDKPAARDYAKIIGRIKDRPDKHLIETVLLRSMPMAVYSEENLGHFGLAFAAYTHFTSPIRRYPDLLVHRTIRDLIIKSKTGLYSREEMRELGAHCSMTERRAEEASREVVQRLKCEYIKNSIGEIFDGTISGVTGFGIFVELNEVYVEGLVHVTGLPGDYYHFDPIHHRLTGERSGRVFRLAGKVRVKVMRVDVDDKKIDFELVDG